MPFDFAGTLDGAIYPTIAEPVTIVPQSSPGSVDMLAIDMSAGKNITQDGVSIQTIEPHAKVRMTELAAKGLTRDDLDNAILTFTRTGARWKIHSTQPLPSPNGESKGELALILRDAS